MAKKQTLKSLLGASDERVQVSYDPSEITLAPTVQQTRGSGTVVQAMPQTNQALNFARALNQVPQVLGQMKNIGQVQAVEDFSQMSEDERKAAMYDDKKISRWLGYDKAFQEALVKDYFVRNQKTITQRFTDLANNPAKYGGDGEFDAAITNEKNTLIEELQEEFGNNPNRVLAINAFGDNVLTEVVGKTTAMYEANKINYTLDMEGAFLQSQIVEDDVDPKTALSNRMSKVATFPEITNQKKKEFLVTHSLAIGTELENMGQYKKAAEVVQAALDYQFFKGAKISGNERKQLSNLLENIETEQESISSKSLTQSSQMVSGLFASTSLILRNNDGQLEETERNSVERILEVLNPNIDNKEIDSFIETLEQLNNGQQRAVALQNKLAEIGTSNSSSDFTRDLYALSGDNFLSSIEKLSKTTAAQFTGIPQEELDIMVNDAPSKFRNSDKTLREFMEEYGFGNIKKIPTQILSIYRDEHKLDYLEDIPAFSQLTSGENNENPNAFIKNKVDEAFLSTGAKLSEFNDRASIRAFQIGSEVRQEIKEFAEGYNEPDINKRNVTITNKINELVTENIGIEKMIFEGESIFKRKEKSIAPGQPDIDVGVGTPPMSGTAKDALNKKTKSSKGKSIQSSVKRAIGEYDHLLNLGEYIRKGNIANIPDLNNYFNKAYSDMRETNDRQALKATMLAFGYPSFDEKIGEDLKETGLKIAEVKMFGAENEFVSITDQFREIVEILEANGEPSEEQMSTFKTMQSLGITDKESFDYFRDVQFDLLFNQQ